VQGDVGFALTGAAVVDGDADARAFAAWVEPHWLSMHRLAVRLCGASDGEDVLQEALAAAWRKRRQFDAGRGRPQAWLLAIVADQARKHWARFRFSRSAESDLVDDADEAARSESVVDMGRAVRMLSPRQRLAVSLYYYLDLPVSEVAEVMSCSEGTVKSTLADARDRLQQLLGQEY
jgi:RNA polymerase sigma factor (sigma-70 family)